MVETQKNIKIILFTVMATNFVNKQYGKPLETCFSEDAFETFLNNMINESECCGRENEKGLVNLLLWLKKIMKILINLLYVGLVKNHLKR